MTKRYDRALALNGRGNDRAQALKPALAEALTAYNKALASRSKIIRPVSMILPIPLR